MVIDERSFRGHFGFDTERRMKVSMENTFELRIAIDHTDGTAYIALEPREVSALRDTLAEWLERRRHAPAAAGRHATTRELRTRKTRE
jgi:hypothetical protein